MRAVERRDERGVVIVLMAMSMIMLLTFAALAVDYGALTNERRRDQTAADGAALAAGGQLKDGNGRDPAVDEAIVVSHENLETGVTLEEWRQRFDTDCTDPGKPAGYTASTLSDCISFNAFNTRVRVKLPTLSVPAGFARVIGVDSMASSAFAEAELVPEGFGRILPFGVPSAAGGGPELCLKTDTNPSATEPCAGPDSGNFGSVDLSLFGNPAMGTPQICGNAQTNDKLAANIILGVDHPLDEWGEGGDPLDPTGTEPIRDDHLLCPDLGARPNAVWAQTGKGRNLDEGLVAGQELDGRDLPGRLTLGPFADGQVRDGASRLDDRPLWEYIPNTVLSGVPASCQRAAFSGATATKAQITACINDYNGPPVSTAELFTEKGGGDPAVFDILESPRFGYVPLFHPHESGDDTFLEGNKRYKIKEFLPIFLQTLYFKCNPGGCRAIFDPGEPSVDLPAASNELVEGLTAFLLPRSMLPSEVLALAPGGEFDRTLILRR